MVMLVLGLNGYSQRYFPKLNNLFLEQSGRESLFSEDLNYFREGLRSANNKLFYRNLQTSSNTGAAFYSMGIIPRFVTEIDFMATGMLLKFKGKSDEEFPSFPIIFNEFTDTDGETKAGNGEIDVFNGGLSLAFASKQIAVAGKKADSDKAEFVIKKISYTIVKDKLSVKLQGEFSTAILIKKKKLAVAAVKELKIEVVKDFFTLSAVNAADGKETIIIKQKAVK